MPFTRLTFVSFLLKCIKESTKSFVLDAEAVAIDRVTGKLMPFQELSKRKRKDVKVEDIQVRVCLFAFDLLYLNGEVRFLCFLLWQSRATHWQSQSTMTLSLYYKNRSTNAGSSCGNISRSFRENSSLQSRLIARLQMRYKVFWKRVSRMAAKVSWLKC